MTPPTFGMTLAIHPDKRGFSWTAFTGPLAAYDWGAAKAAGDKNLVCLRKIERLLDRLSPETLVLEAFELGKSRRNPRIARLGRSLVALASMRGVEVAIYTREEVRACFAHMGAKTRQEIAEAVLRHNPVFRSQIPRPRRLWEDEHHRMALFTAAALVATHHHRGAATLFDEMR